jgi:transcriptional regulator GlxA family with amidase domain
MVARLPGEAGDDRGRPAPDVEDAMHAAFVIFNRMTALDFVGAYDPLGRLHTMGLLPDFEWTVCAATATVSDDRGLLFLPDLVGESLERFDVLVVPGGQGTRTLRHDPAFMTWLRTAEGVPLKASVCTGALLLGAAGFLTGKPATTHPSAMRDLEPYCGEVRPERVVDAGGVVTSRGVTAGIDLGLHLVRRLAGAEASLRVAEQMDYPHLSVHASP